MQHFIISSGIIAIFVLMVAESACIPIPSEVTMLLGGALAGGAISGAHPNLVMVIAAGTLGNLTGSYLAWAAGRYGGRELLHRWGRYICLTDHDVDRAHGWFARHGALSVLFGRMLPVVRTFISLPAGVAEMPATRFGVYTLLGCLPWVAALTVTGYLIGDRWETIAHAFTWPSYILAAAIALAVATFLLARRRRTTPTRASS